MIIRDNKDYRIILGSSYTPSILLYHYYRVGGAHLRYRALLRVG